MPSRSPLPRTKVRPTLLVLQPMIDVIRSPHYPPKNGAEFADHIVAVLDTVARALADRDLSLTATHKALTAHQGPHKVNLRLVERSKRVPASGASAKWRSFDLQPTGFLYITTDGYVAWGDPPRRQPMVWDEKPNLPTQELAQIVAADVSKVFDAEQRWDVVEAERRRRSEREQAERDRVRREAAALKARCEQQDALVNTLVQQAAQVRELRQFLAEAVAPEEDQDGYQRLLTSVVDRLATLEQNLEPNAIEALIRAKGLFPPPDEEG